MNLRKQQMDMIMSTMGVTMRTTRLPLTPTATCQQPTPSNATVMKP
jgi:hypothetical protein